MCFVWIWEQTAIISVYSVNWLVCITESECVYCAVRTGSIYNSTFCPHSVFMWISEQTAFISLYSINWLVCITETECVYCAVRTGSLYIYMYIVQVYLSVLEVSGVSWTARIKIQQWTVEAILILCATFYALLRFNFVIKILKLKLWSSVREMTREIRDHTHLLSDRHW